LRPRGRPIEEEVPTVVHGMRRAALRAVGVVVFAGVVCVEGVVTCRS